MLYISLKSIEFTLICPVTDVYRSALFLLLLLPLSFCPLYTHLPVWSDESRFSVLLLGSSTLGVSLVVATAASAFGSTGFFSGSAASATRRMQHKKSAASYSSETKRRRERERGREGKINMTANKVQYANFNAFLMHNARCGKQIPQSGASGKGQGEHGRYLIEILPYSFVSLPVSILHVACCMLRIGSDSCAMMLFVYHNNLHYNFIIISLNWFINAIINLIAESRY